MAQTIQIKRRHASVGTPTALENGEFAYNAHTNEGKLYIGRPGASTATIDVVGGKYFMDLLDHTLGTLTASSALLVDANSKLDILKSGNIVVTGSSDTISTSSGNLTIAPTANLVITHAGTINISAQSNEISIKDNDAAAVNFTEGSNSYLKLDTTNSAEKVILGKQTIINGDGSTGGVTISDGKIEVRTGTGNAGRIDVYDSSGNDQKISIISPDAVSSDVTLTLPIVTSTIVGTVGAQTLADKTLNAPIIDNANIDNGTIDGTEIGSTTPDSGAFTFVVVDNLRLDDNIISSKAGTNADIQINPNGTGTVTVPADYMTRGGFTANSLTPKAYVDSVKQALDIKASVRLATTANLAGTYNNGAGTLTNSGAQAALAMDDVTVTANDRILVKNQTAGAQNGIYTVTTVGDGSTNWVLTRADDADENEDVTAGLFTFVSEGTAGADNGYVLVTDGAITLGTTAFTFEQFSGAGQIDPGTSMSKSGNTLNVDVDDKTIEHSGDTGPLQIKGVGATAVGDVLLGVAANGGYSVHAKPAANTTTAKDYLLTMDTNGAALWSKVLDGGVY